MIEDFVVFGLGTTGAAFLDQFAVMIGERQSLLPVDRGVPVAPLTIHLEADGAFDWMVVTDIIDKALAQSRTKLHNTPARCIVIGNLGEPGVADLASNLAYLLRHLDRDSLVPVASVNGFMTMTDRLGKTEAAGSGVGTAINRFFESCGQTTRDTGWKNSEGRELPPLIVGHSVFNRIYMTIAPGDMEVLLGTTLRVMAERVCLELGFMPDVFRNFDSRFRSIKLDEGYRDRVLATFSMVEVPSLVDLQKDMLRLHFEQVLLAEHEESQPAIMDETVLTDAWFDAMGIDPEGDGPVSPLTELALSRSRGDLEAIKQEGSSSHGPAERLEAMRQRFGTVLARVLETLPSLVATEIAHLDTVIADGAKELMSLKGVAGRFPLMDCLFGKLEDWLTGWDSPAIQASGELCESGPSDPWELAGQWIKQLEGDRILGTFLFRPLRTELANAILDQIDLTGIACAAIRTEVTRIVAERFDSGAEHGQPLARVRKIRTIIASWRKAVACRRDESQGRMKVLLAIPGQYHAEAWFTPETLESIFARLRERATGGERYLDLQKTARSTFAAFLQAREVWDLEDAVSAYLGTLANVARAQAENFSSFETDISQEETFAGELSGKVRSRLERLSAKSFRIAPAQGDHTRIAALFMPTSTRSTPLRMSLEALAQDLPDTTVFTTDPSMFHGSSFVLLEHHFLRYQDLVSHDSFSHYGTGIPAMTQTVPGPASARTTPEQVPGPSWLKRLRIVVQDYMDQPTFRQLAELGGAPAEPSLSDTPQVERIVTTVGLKRTLDLLSLNHLQAVTRDYGLPVPDSRDDLLFQLAQAMEAP